MTTDSSTFSMQVGSIIAILADPEHPPDNWFWCDGSNINALNPNNSMKYPELAGKLINNMLPDLRGITLIGAGEGRWGTYNAQDTYGSSPDHTLTIDEMPSHQHFGFGEHNTYGWGLGRTKYSNYPGSNGGQDEDNCYYASTWTGGNGNDPILTDNDSKTYGGPVPNQSFSILQPSLAINFFIYAGEPGAAAVKGD